jgi:hypothetical protein
VINVRALAEFDGSVGAGIV